ncbi:hypothetical protein QSH57_002199 [Fusarium oxysporum f. sp. vasinfectum]|nr:hypothetical protein QSH57_002199 [Fusarium oxysporum f. sp. vasinfectum]
MTKGAAEPLMRTGGPVQQERARFVQSQSCAARARTLANAAATKASSVKVPVSADEGDPPSSSEEQEEYPENHEPGSSSDAGDLSQLVTKHLTDVHGDGAVQPFTPMSSNTSLVMNETNLFADFLKDIIYSGNDARAAEPAEAAPFNPMSMDILDFGPLQGTFPQTRVESSWCYPPMACQDYFQNECLADDTNRGNIISSEYAFSQSLWSWAPKEGDHWRSETTKMMPCIDDLVADFNAQDPQIYASTPMLASTRHRLISMMLSISGTADYERIMSTFPSLTTLDYLLSKDLQRRSIEPDSWIHIATFDPNLACPQLVLGIIISGAFRCCHPLLWKLGLAMLELHLELCLRLFSSNHRNARLATPIQIFAITIEAGLWSGDSRRLELCEAFCNTLVTMARRGGYFRLGPFEGQSPHIGDSLDVLETKWQIWADHESRKRFDSTAPSSYSHYLSTLAYHLSCRLAIHILNICTQFSLALVTTPLVRYTEMSVPLPAARSLWNASSAEAWRSAYLALENQNLACLPELRSCYSNFATLLHLGDAHDAPSTGLAILSGLWVNVWQYKERVNARNTGTETLRANSALIIESLQQEARGILEDFKNVYAQLMGTMEPNLLALHEQQLMHLYVSLEDVQYLGGKAGEAEARRILPLLTDWVKGRSSRRAVWHAGQILRVVRQGIDPALRASITLAVYHASLTIWSYLILSDAPSVDMPAATSQRKLYPDQDRYAKSEPLALIDGDDTPAVQRFLLVPGARAAISAPAKDVQPILLHISTAPAVMTAIAALFKDCAGFKGNWNCPSLVDNLTRLVEQLGRAAESFYISIGE